MEQTVILLIEDEEDIAETTKFALEKKGYDVFTVTSGQEGIDKFKSLSPDVILLDIRMPKMDGFQTLENLRKTYPDSKNVPVIMLTANVQSDFVLKARQHGAAGYVAKAGNIQNLLAKIKEVLPK